MLELIEGIHTMVPTEKLPLHVRKLRDAYAITPNASFVQKEFGFFSFDHWADEGHFDGKDHNPWEYDDYITELFGFDKAGNYNLNNLGWTEAAFVPTFDELLIEDRGEHEVIQDFAGRHVLFFKGKRSGFMPEYIDHPVKDKKTWEEKCKWRLNPTNPERLKLINDSFPNAVEHAKNGYMITQRLIGGYMYLRSLMGPEDLLYMVYDDPDLIHDCMKTWFNLSDFVIAKHQEFVTLDEIFFGEDICYNNGSLISPDMINEFIIPYYQQLITNIKGRQLDKNRHLYLQIDTDGFAVPVIDIYKKVGMDAMSPFEVASYCDVVKIGKDHPDIFMSGGIDKRILASNKEEIDRHLDYILPTMKKRGGYIPTCDHGVPEEVSFENYMHYRKRCLEYSI